MRRIKFHKLFLLLNNIFLESIFNCKNFTPNCRCFYHTNFWTFYDNVCRKFPLFNFKELIIQYMWYLKYTTGAWDFVSIAHQVSVSRDVVRRDALYISAVFTTLWVSGVVPECANEKLATVTHSLQPPLLRLMQHFYILQPVDPLKVTQLQLHRTLLGTVWHKSLLVFRHRLILCSSFFDFLI